MSRHERVPAICRFCGNAFMALSDQIRRGRGKFCSVACGRRARPLADSLQNIDRSSGLFGCWPWLGNCNKDGYGRISLRRGVIILAHRYAFEKYVGPIPEGQRLLHSCDNPPCCNPAHLSVGTQADNVADMIAKGRARFHFREIARAA
jgi:hypothetical protein